MANPILKEDLIANDVQPALDKMLETLGKIDGALTSMRGSLSQHAKGIMDDVNAHQSDAEAMGKYAAKITELEKAISDLTKAQKENANMQSQVHAAKAKSIELSEYEKRHLEELEKRLKLGAVWQERTAQAIDTTNMSYNAMKATLNTLLSTLRSFETESKKNSTEAMALESAVERLRDAMKELDGNTKAVANAEKQMAEESKKAAKEAADAAKEEEKAYQASQKEAKARADAAQKIHDARQKEIEDAFKARDAEQQRLKLNDQEFAALNQLKAALASEGKARLDALNAIDAQKMSYNELQQTYNVLMTSIKGMSTEEVRSSDAGKLMVITANKLRETMNETQKSVGNYTLQVGKYRAAFDGLGYSMQQILREAPSALNLNQFFLAISNNIPQFLDQLKAFKDEQADIAENLKKMTEGTEEYIKEQGKQMTVGQKLWKSIKSWQTLVLVGLMALRNYGEKIIDWFSDLFSGAKKAESALKIFDMTMRDINRNAASAIANASAELSILMERLDGVTKGTEDWKKIVERVNEITGETLDYQKAMPDEIRKVTQAYLDQMLAIEKNKQIAETLAKSTVGRNLISNSIGRIQGVLENEQYSPEDIVRMMGLDPKEQDDIISLIKQYRSSTKSSSGENTGFFLANAALDVMTAIARSPIISKRTEEEWLAAMSKMNTDNEIEFIAEMQKIAQAALGVLPEDVEEMLRSQYTLVGATRNTKGRGKEKSPTEQEMNNQFWKAAEARRNIMLVGYQKELADEKAAHLQQMQEQSRANEEMQKAVEENVKNEKITKEEGARRIQELQKQNNVIMEGLILEHNKRVNVINTKYAELDRQVIVEEELGWIEELDEAYKVADNNRRRRIKTIKDEEISNRNITESIIKMREEIDKLMQRNLTQPEAIEQRTKRIQELEKAIAKLQAQIDHTKQLSTYSSVGDIFRRNVSVGAGTQQSLMESILGTDAYSAFTPGSKEMQDAIEKDFETWMQSVEKTATEWYNTTMGYINDLISAYVELANAKAEAAKEATEAAQEEYDKEKALLEAGYASRVEATWAEYQEKKAAQEKAEEDAKAAAKAQQEINNLSTMGSLITAAANIWKTFTEIPVVGIPLAIAATGTMFGAFLEAKIKANEVSKYGEGGFEVLEGGSHASGHDIDLGVRNRRGRRMKAEGKEGIGIFSVRAMNHYGDRNIEGFVNSINRLEFEGNAAKRMSLERSVGMAVLSAPRTDLHRVENSLDKLVSYGSRSRYTEADGTVVEVRKSGVVRYRK